MKPFICLLLAAAPLAAQPVYPRSSFTVGVGVGRPSGELSGAFRNSAALAVNYGFRFYRYLQADVGLDTLFGAAGIREFLPSPVFGDLRIRDYQLLIPFGGRVVIPLGNERVLVSFGGGGARLNYQEVLGQPSEDIHIECRSCRDRGGWAYYGLAGASVALDRVRMFRVGVTARMYRGYTEGNPFGLVPGVRTNDRWLGVFGEFGVAF